MATDHFCDKSQQSKHIKVRIEEARASNDVWKVMFDNLRLNYIGLSIEF